MLYHVKDLLYVFVMKRNDLNGTQGTNNKL